MPSSCSRHSTSPSRVRRICTAHPVGAAGKDRRGRVGSTIVVSRPGRGECRGPTHACGRRTSRCKVAGEPSSSRRCTGRRGKHDRSVRSAAGRVRAGRTSGRAIGLPRGGRHPWSPGRRLRGPAGLCPAGTYAWPRAVRMVGRPLSVANSSRNCVGQRYIRHRAKNRTRPPVCAAEVLMVAVIGFLWCGRAGGPGLSSSSGVVGPQVRSLASGRVLHPRGQLSGLGRDRSGDQQSVQGDRR